MKKTRTIKVVEEFCDLCGEEITEHFGEALGKCPECHRDICPRCTGVYKAEISKFKGYSGVTLPLRKFSRTLCLECGIKFEAKLVEFGLTLKQSTPPLNG